MQAMEKDQKKRKLLGILILIFAIAFMLLIAYLVGVPMVKLVKNPEKFRLWISSHGFWGDLAFIGMMVLQVVIAVIPGEPFEIGAGYAFGFWEGSALCVLAIAIGSAMIYALMHLVGRRFALLFFSQEKLDSVSFLNNEKKLDAVMFLLMFLPGTPKDLLSYAAGLTRMPFWRWMLIVTVARIPSVLTSTIGGNALGMKNYVFSIVVFSATLLVSLLGLLLYKRICRRKSRKKDKEV